MDSPQSVVSPFKNSSAFTDPEKQTAELFLKTPGYLSGGKEAERKNNAISSLEESVGVLDVFVHQARDIHNICIYHKQDVYAKLCLTSDPEHAVSTKIINGGGQNPVFNDNLQLDVHKLDTSLKCEIWMLSRVRNYLEDQLLGFALVPLSEVLMENGKLDKDFSLSSTDLFHSPAGFVHLSIAYKGSLPDVLAISSLPARVICDETLQDAEAPESVPTEFDKIEFPDPKIDKENDEMVSEYFEIACASLESQNKGSFSPSADNSEDGVQLVESISNATLTFNQSPKHDSPPNSESVYGSPSSTLPVSSHSFETAGVSKSSDKEHASPSMETAKEKSSVLDAKSNESSVLSGDSFVNPFFNVNVEPEQKVVQQDFVDMYMKSMQQFTESLAKMKLPLDIDNGPTSCESTSDEKLQGKKTSGSRVFYGSRAFF